MDRMEPLIQGLPWSRTLHSLSAAVEPELTGLEGGIHMYICRESIIVFAASVFF